MALYRLYGMTVETDLHLPGLPQIDGPADVQIRIGTVPSTLDHARIKTEYFEVNESCFLMHVPDIAKYLVIGGRKVIVQKLSSNDAAMQLYLLGSVMAALIHQRGNLPLHGSAIVASGKAILFAGASGAGKSTMAAALHKKGFDLLADDICVVELNGKRVPYVKPGIPKQKLWKDMLDFWGEDPGKFQAIYSLEGKYDVPISERFADRGVPLQNIFILQQSEDKAVYFREIKGLSKIHVIRDNIYRHEFRFGMDRQSVQIEYETAIASQVRIFEVFRSRNQGIEKVLAAMLSQLLQLENE